MTDIYERVYDMMMMSMMMMTYDDDIAINL
jgi:hypothetical protein